MLVGGFDPGIRRAGLVIWSTDRQEVVGAHLFLLPGVVDRKKVRGDLAAQMMVAELRTHEFPYAQRMVVEGQHTHGHKRTMDIVRLAQVAGAAAGTCNSPEVLLVPPGTWTGGFRKEIHQNRTLRKAGLSRGDLAQMVGCTERQESELIDALGLALYGTKIP